VLDSLVEEFHPQTTFEVDDQGRIVVVMDSASVERSFARLNG
jgi:nitrate reductase NapAB chaperone NapD